MVKKTSFTKLNFSPKHKDMFVAVGLSYEETTMIQAVENKNDKSQLDGAYLGSLIPGKRREMSSKPLSEFPGPYFPAFSIYTAVTPEKKAYQQLYKTIRKITEDFLLGRPKFSSKIQELEDHILKKGYSIEEVEAVLKAMLADTLTCKYHKTSSGEYISFSSYKSQYHNDLLYYGSIGEELKIKSNRISLLVSHGQTVGNYREVILRDLINDHLPSQFSCSTGFIQGFEQQLDIIVYDSQNFSPLFKEGDLVVLKQEAVRAIIEVKTNLTPSTLKDVLEMFHHISLPGFKTTLLPIFKAVYSFDSTYTKTSSIAKYVYDFYNKPYFNPQVQYEMVRDVLYLYHEVSCITAMNKHCVFSKYIHSGKDNTGNIVPTLFSVFDRKGIDVQTATFLSLLFEYLDVQPYAKKSSVWSLAKIIGPTSQLKFELKLTADDWFPRSRREGEHNGDQKSIKRRVKTIDDWFSGEMSTSELIADQSSKKNMKDTAEELGSTSKSF